MLRKLPHSNPTTGVEEKLPYITELTVSHTCHVLYLPGVTNKYATDVLPTWAHAGMQDSREYHYNQLHTINMLLLTTFRHKRCSK